MPAAKAWLLYCRGRDHRLGASVRQRGDLSAWQHVRSTSEKRSRQRGRPRYVWSRIAQRLRGPTTHTVTSCKELGLVT